MKRSLTLTFAAVAAFAASASIAAAAAPMTPMTIGFHQHLACNGGYVLTEVSAPDPKTSTGGAELVTTTIAVGPQLTTTKTLRSVDGQGNIYGMGYVIQTGVVKRFPKQLLLPAHPAAGQHTSYSNITGATIEKRFDGTRATKDARGHALTGYAFSDFIGSRKVNTAVYVPGFGLTELRFANLQSPSADLVCRVSAK
jgi:hypothetical protein